MSASSDVSMLSDSDVDVPSLAFGESHVLPLPSQQGASGPVRLDDGGGHDGDDEDDNDSMELPDGFSDAPDEDDKGMISDASDASEHETQPSGFSPDFNECQWKAEHAHDQLFKNGRCP